MVTKRKELMGRTGRLLANQPAHKGYQTTPVFQPGYLVVGLLGQFAGEQVGTGDPPSAKEAVDRAHARTNTVSTKRTTLFIKRLLYG
jgi:hypothetical protein